MKLYCLQKRSITAFSTYYTKGFSILVLGLLSYCSLQAQTITAKQRDVIIIDNGAPGKADPGDRIMYDVTISNSGATQGNNTQLNINPDPRTTFIPGSFKSSPLALDDNYNATGNIGITISAGSGVLLNDFDDNIPGLTVTAGTFATTQGGSIDMAANGSFSYKPKAGFIGSDQFVYTLNDSDPVGPPVPATNTGTISFTVSQMVWFIDNSASLSANTGTFSDPFKTIGAFNTANTGAALKPQDNDLISLRRGTGTYAEADGINLRLGQRLIGEAVQFNTVFTADVNSLSAYQTFASGTMASPVIAASAGNGVDLLSGNTLRGFNIGNCSGIGLNGLAFGTLTLNTISINSTGQAMTLINGTIAGAGFSSVSSSGGVNNISLGALSGTLALGSGALSGATGASFGASQGTATVTYSGTINKTAITRIIDIQNLTGGSYTFSGLLTHNAAGGTQESIFLNLNSTAAITFSGGLSLTSTSTAAVFSATTGGTVTVTGASNTISSTVGTGLNLQSTNAGGSGITFASIICTSGQVANINSSTGTKTLGRVSTSSGTANSVDLNSAGTVNIGSASLSSTLTTSSGICIKTAGASTTVNLTGIGFNLNSTTGNGLNMNNGTVSSTGGNLIIITTNGTGFTATGGGTVNVTGAGNTISSPTGTALNVSSTNIGASGLTFQSISSNGSAGPNGIILSSTGTNGLTVTGTGSAGSGGTISSKTGADGSSTQGTGIYLNSCESISLSRMDIQNCQNYGIRGFNVTGFTLNNSTVGTSSTNGTSSTVDTDPTSLEPGEASIRFFNLLGSASISNCQLAGGFARTVFIANNTGTLDRLTITNSTLSQTQTSSSGDALLVQANNDATVNFTVTGCTFTAGHQSLILTDARSTSTMDIQINTSTFSNSASIASASNNLILNGGGTDCFVTFDIHNNSFRQGSGGSAPANGGRCVTAGMVSGGGKFDGKFMNNTVGVSGIAFSGSGNGADGLGFFASGNKAATTRGSGTLDSRFLIQGNTIKRYGETGIIINARQGNSILDATIIGNSMSEPGSAAQGAFGAIWVNAGALPPDQNKVNIAIGSITGADKNTMQDSDPSNATDVFLDSNSCGGCGSVLTLYRNGSGASGAGETLIRNILNDDNNPTLDLLAGFINGSTISIAAGLPPQPTN